MHPRTAQRARPRHRLVLALTISAVMPLAACSAGTPDAAPPATGAPSSTSAGTPTSEGTGTSTDSTSPSGTPGSPNTEAPGSAEPTDNAGPGDTGPTETSGLPDATNPPDGQPPVSAAEKKLRGMSLPERVGQLFMAGVPATGASAAVRQSITRRHLGNIMLTGRSQAGAAATKAVASRLRSAVAAGTPDGVDAFVSTDQEGGYVQVLSGPGFSTIPTALTQGNWAPPTLRNRSTQWGKQLAAAGINVNLAPVADTVPSPQFAPKNKPIGYFQREYGFAPGIVSTHVQAFSAGMRAAGVQPVVKHFPGLGRVVKNTDTATGVTDNVTTRHDPFLQPFRDAIDDGAGWVMISSAKYPRIDAAHIAPFSSVIMRDMLRRQMGFDGIIVSDDLCAADQLSGWKLGNRATKFLAAGGTMVLCVEAPSAATMTQAVVQRAKTSDSFARKVDAAALKVLQAKARL